MFIILVYNPLWIHKAQNHESALGNKRMFIVNAYLCPITVPVMMDEAMEYLEKRQVRYLIMILWLNSVFLRIIFVIIIQL